MFNYKNYDPPVEPRGNEVEIESLKIMTDFANMAMAGRDFSRGAKGVKGIYGPTSHEWADGIAGSVGDRK